LWVITCFLFPGMVVEIMAATSPVLGCPPMTATETSTTVDDGDTPSAVGGAYGRSMVARSGCVVAGEGRALEIRAAAARVGRGWAS
jgi:hypothetical protein